MMQLAVRNQTTDAWTMLDTTGVSMELTLALSDISDVTARRASHSLSIQLPFTPDNDAFFGHVTEVDVDNPASYNSFDITKKCEGEVSDDGETVMTGVLKMLSIDLSARKYECVFFSEVADLFENIRGKEWADIFRLSDGNISQELDHNFTAQNIIDSWDITNDITQGSAGAGVIVYPLSDYGTGGSEDQPADSPMYASTGYVGGYPSGVGGLFVAGHLTSRSQKPSIKVKYLLEKIVQFGGYNLAPHTFIDTVASNFKSLYMQIGTETVFAAGRAANGFMVGLAADQTFATVDAGDAQGLEYTDEGAGYWDEENLVSSATFYAPFEGYFWFGTAMRLSSVAGSGSYEAKIIIYRDGTAYQSETRTVPYNADYQFNMQYQVFCTINQQVTVGLVVYNSAQVVTLEQGSDSWWTMYQYNNASPNSPTCDVVANLPKGSVDKWLGAIMDKFNLVMIADDEAKEVTFETWVDYITTSPESKNWESKIQKNGPMLLRPTTEEQNSRVEFSDVEGEDRFNAWSQTHNGKVRGSTTFYAPSDFAKGVKEIGGYFRPYRQSPVRRGWNASTMLPEVGGGSAIDMLWSEQWEDWDGTRLTVSTGAPMLMFYHGSQTNVHSLSGANPIYIDGVSTELWPLFSVNSREPATSTDYSLDWGPGIPDITEHDSVGMAGRTSAQKFWLDFLDELYSPAARTMECKAILTAHDISSLKFNDHIHISGTVYRVLEITNYQVGKLEPCNVKLLKSLTASDPTCGLIPTATAAGVVTWTDAATGSAATGTAYCCRKWGYTWNSATDTCVWTGGVAPAGLRGGSRGMNKGFASQPLVGGARVESFGFGQKRGSGQKHTWEMTTHTTSTTLINAVTPLGESVIVVPQERLVGIKISYVTNISSGANRGQATYGEDAFTISAFDKTGAKVSGASEVFAKGNAATTDIDVVVTTGDVTSFVVQVTGIAAESMDWFITVEATIYDSDRQKFGVDYNDAQWENGDFIQFNDTTTMAWD